MAHPRSALLNVMTAAAQKAARRMVRDFGEVENLQVSKKGPADFVSIADKKAEDTLVKELKKPVLIMALFLKKGPTSKVRTRPTPGSLIRSTAPQIFCTAFHTSPSPSHWCVTAILCRRRLQSGHR